MARTIEQIIDQIRIDAGADFAFVLSRKGRLVTTRAPRDMPEEGRARLVRAARPLLAQDDPDASSLVTLTVPREDLVPYGGAAPVDVFVGVAAAQALVCVVMASWADRSRVAPALEQGLLDLEPILRRGAPSVGRNRAPSPVKGSPFRRAPDSAPPPVAPKAPLSTGALVSTSPAGALRSPSASPSALFVAMPARPVVTSRPEIHVGEAELGRLSMAAVRHEVDASDSRPDITYGETELGRASLAAIGGERIASSSAPEIIVTGEAALGRETLVAIDVDSVEMGASPGPAPGPQAARAGRTTLTWGELDTARAGARKR